MSKVVFFSPYEETAYKCLVRAEIFHTALVIELFIYFSFPPPFVEGNMSISWLYETLVTNWTVWLPESTKHTINW